MNKLNLQIPIVASACPIEIQQDLNMLGMVITKSVTMLPIEGNISSYDSYNNYSINNQGLPNLGIEKFIETTLPLYNKIIKENIPLVLSIQVNNVCDLNVILTKLQLVKDDFQGIELNISCPNTANKKEFQDIELVMFCNTVSDYFPDKFFSLKLAPTITDYTLFGISSNTKVEWLNCFNTVPLSNMVYNAKGGITGAFVKDPYINRIKSIKDVFKDRFNVIATGGVFNVKDVSDYISSGADLVGVASHFLNSKGNIKRLVTEYVEYSSSEKDGK